MTVSRKDTEIFSQAHEMYAEGTSDTEPTKDEITELLSEESWEAYDIEIFYDNLQGFWRWYCLIIKGL
jgi:hypothetical protein